MTRDIITDSRSDIRSGAGSEIKVDYGGDLAKDKGIDLNAGTENTSEVKKDQDHVGEDLNDNQLDAVLDNFQDNKWSDLSLEDKKQSMNDLADYVAADTGNQKPPDIVFRDDMPDGSYGGYNPETNTMEINVNMLDDSAEAADTIAHEMWHAYQQQEASDPNSEKGREYQEGFDNYISPEYDFEGYENQPVEAEARDYAQGFKDRINKAA
jgi:soluble cytochrome b562